MSNEEKGTQCLVGTTMISMPGLLKEVALIQCTHPMALLADTTLVHLTSIQEVDTETDTMNAITLQCTTDLQDLTLTEVDEEKSLPLEVEENSTQDLNLTRIQDREEVQNTTEEEDNHHTTKNTKHASPRTKRPVDL